MNKCLGYNELSKKLPKSIKRIFDKSRREHNILKSDDYVNMFESSKICNRGFPVAQNNGDILIYDIYNKRFCGFNHESKRCIYGKDLYKKFTQFVELASIDYDHNKIPTDKQLLVIENALKIKYKVPFKAEYDKKYRTIYVNPVPRSDKDILKILSFIDWNYLKSAKRIIKKVFLR